MRAKRAKANASPGGVLGSSFMAAGVNRRRARSNETVSGGWEVLAAQHKPPRIKPASPPSESQPQATVVAQQRAVAVSGQKSQDLLRRTHGAAQLLPELLSTLNLGGQHLPKGIFETIDSGQKALPGSLQAASLDDLRRRIEPTAHLRLIIEIRLEPIHFKRAVSQASHRQYRNGMPALRAQEAMHREPGFLLAAHQISPIPAMTVHLGRAAVRTTRSISLKAVRSNLDGLL